MMNLSQSINRGFNLLAVSIVGLAGVAFVPEAFLENDFPDKLDDMALFLLGGFAAYWYSRSENKYLRSVLPVVFVALALVIKAIGIFIEFDDKESVGDDFGGLILFISAAVLVLYQYRKTGRLLEKAS